MPHHKADWQEKEGWTREGGQNEGEEQRRGRVTAVRSRVDCRIGQRKAG